MATLGGLEAIPKRYFLQANRFWWAYVIAEEFHISPLEVKEWPAEEVLETLAYLQLTKPKGGETE